MNRGQGLYKTGILGRHRDAGVGRVADSTDGKRLVWIGTGLDRYLVLETTQCTPKTKHATPKTNEN